MSRLAACAAVSSALLLTSCTASGSGEDTADPRPTSTAAGPSERELTERAQAAIAAVRGGTMVEAGVERVRDGIHTEPGLSEGKDYRLTLVCVGTGTARLAFVPARAAAEASVPCDESVVRQRITGGEFVRIDVVGAEGATGVVAWQIDAL
ncbi:hypothetical protein [Streptomyces sp. YS415]|uniref:hypothetical protein n=1 Tax=Streptomyces sp. YS415 TaxID=2944806 RepID=UPI0020207FC6|nr:hypothetical protein [Streptomyces sp. YS415]MCL7425641.1 hypothetical protein [Streptomyces sp. YS415]